MYWIVFLFCSFALGARGRQCFGPGVVGLGCLFFYSFQLRINWSPQYMEIRLPVGIVYITVYE